MPPNFGRALRHRRHAEVTGFKGFARKNSRSRRVVPPRLRSSRTEGGPCRPPRSTRPRPMRSRDMTAPPDTGCAQLAQPPASMAPKPIRNGAEEIDVPSAYRGPKAPDLQFTGHKARRSRAPRKHARHEADPEGQRPPERCDTRRHQRVRGGAREGHARGPATISKGRLRDRVGQESSPARRQDRRQPRPAPPWAERPGCARAPATRSGRAARETGRCSFVSPSPCIRSRDGPEISQSSEIASRAGGKDAAQRRLAPRASASAPSQGPADCPWPRAQQATGAAACQKPCPTPNMTPPHGRARQTARTGRAAARRTPPGGRA